MRLSREQFEEILKRPNSPDAMFARICERLDQQAIVLERIERRQEEDAVRVGSRLGALEQFRAEIKTKVAAASAIVSAVIAAAWQYLLNRPHDS